MRKLIDIGVNLTDKVFTGVYRGKVHHENDFHNILQRAFTSGIQKMIITGGSASDSAEALSIANSDPRLFCTVGCHPTRCLEFAASPDDYAQQLQDLILSSPDKVVAVGECGLDYDREEFCPRDVQKKYFERQLKLANDVNLPLFLHCRAAHSDLVALLNFAGVRFFSNRPIRGVVHTFDGTLSEAKILLEMGLYLGINGCSLKSEENLQVIRSIPLDRILLETDAPWCEIKPTHAGFKYVKTHPTYKKSNRWDPNCMVKSRNEPANIVQVLEVVAALHNVTEDKLADIVYENTVNLFNFHDSNKQSEL